MGVIYENNPWKTEILDLLKENCGVIYENGLWESEDDRPYKKEYGSDTQNILWRTEDYLPYKTGYYSDTWEWTLRIVVCRRIKQDMGTIDENTFWQ